MENTSFWPLLTTQKEHDVSATQAAFLLGGIGTGNVSLSSGGALQDWEIFNMPGKGNVFPYTFFALHLNNGQTGDGRLSHTRVLEGPLQPPHALSHGYDSARLAGLPRMAEARMRAENPLGAVKLSDPKLPATVTLEAYTPFIPLDEEDSALPAAVLRYRVRNSSDAPWFCSVAGSLANMTSFSGYGVFNYVNYASDTINIHVKEEGLQGLLYRAQPTEDGRPIDNTLALLTPHETLTVKPAWYQGAWYDGAQDFWDDFSDDGLLRQEREGDQEGGQILFQARQKIGSVAPHQWLAPGEEAVFTFYLCWHIPRRGLSWWQEKDSRCGLQEPATKNHYALRFTDALAVGRYLNRHLPRLEALTLRFHQAFFKDSSLPQEVLDAASSNITALRSNTCFRIEDGSFFGWEGCFDQSGCCDGNCSHVWNYAQTLAFLFPKLEQSMRRNEFLLETDEKGAMRFRARAKLQGPAWDLPPAIDGQCGSILRLYREWLISQDQGFLDELGEKALLALDFAISYWDEGQDGVPDSRQHNTYDIDFYGSNPLSAGMFLLALRAGEEIAALLGQGERAEGYRALYEKGREKAEALLWNGEYFIQKLTDVDAHHYQHGEGCLSDQLFGQFLAHVTGLGHLLDENKTRQAMKSIYTYNFRRDLSDHENVQRCFALGDEGGLLLCTWPRGGRPRFPFVYSNEVWTGIEYQVAACLIWEGLVEEGLDIVKTARARHDGFKRNPFNEVECGHHYARSLSSWGLVLACSGFGINPKDGAPHISPRLSQEDFRCFYSTGREWGVCTQRREPDGSLKQRFKTLYTADS